MWLFRYKPEFVTVLSDQDVKTGDTVTLHCEANTDHLTVTWEKNGQRLDCVQDKHTMGKNGKVFFLRIYNIEADDEANYTITLQNKQGNASCSARITVVLNEWRQVDWNPDEIMKSLKSYKVVNDQVKHLQFLLCGPVGAGKSSVINTVKTIFEGRLFVNCLAASHISATSVSHTLRYEKYHVGNVQHGLLPLIFSDVMGVEKEANHGVLSDDIISALKGHIKEGYLFNSKSPLNENDLYYHKNPTLSEKVHCLVYVVPADTFSLMKDAFMEKMKTVKAAATQMGLPQVVLMTRVDTTCPLTNKNLRNIYKSKMIKKKMQECAVALGLPVNCIFPVWNYHEETDINQDLNCLMLYALNRIVHWANDFVVKCSNN